MRYIQQHIANIIDKYAGSVPLTHFLKQYFKANPKLGSRDRKMLSEMSYCWYRCSKGITGVDAIEIKINACLFLCNTENNAAINLLPKQWKESKQLPLNEKIEVLVNENIGVDIDKIICYQGVLSEGIERNDWLTSLLHQPALFIRVRKNKEDIIQQLADNNIAYDEIDKTCLSLPNGASVDKILLPDTYVVQDKSSQQTGNYFHPKTDELWWDCCSGAGGKALLLKDKQPLVKLTVTDKRKTILYNLRERFALYGHDLQQTAVLDMSDNDEIKSKMQGKIFDNIICDVPCTGSGTWARTPEQAYYFDKEDLNVLPNLQYTIAVNALSYLKEGGILYYITCSVFEAENEKVVKRLLTENHLQLKEMKLINGISNRADCLFIALLQKQ